MSEPDPELIDYDPTDTGDVAMLHAPRNESAEADLLCTILWSSGDVLDEIEIHPEDFYRPAHELIFRAMLVMHEAAEPIDPTTLADLLQARGELIRAGGLVALHDLWARPGIVTSASHYLRIMRKARARREIGATGLRLQQSALEPTDDPLEAVEAARAHLEALSDRLAGGHGEHDYQQALDAALEAAEHGKSSLATPWVELNDLIGGWRRGSLYVVGAATGGGKTIFGEQAAIDVMRTHDLPAVYVTQEVTTEELFHRGFAQLGEVNLSHIIHNTCGADEWDRLSRAYKEMGDLKFQIEDVASASVAMVKSFIRACKRKHGDCGVVIVDYIQQMFSTEKFERNDLLVSSFSRGLKATAKELQVPVIALSQLNDEWQKAGRPPRMGDLKDAKAIAHDADAVILLHKPADQDHDQPMKVIAGITKNRQGPTDSFELFWEGHYSRMRSIPWSASRSVGA